MRFTTPDDRRERGSAYIIALMALLVLTMGGLAVTLISQTEMQVGVNEKVIHRTFYAAESGLNLATAYVLTVGGACQPARPIDQVAGAPPGWNYVAELENVPGAGTLADVTHVPPAVILFKGCCNFCPCMEGNLDEIHRFNYGMVADAERRTTSPGVVDTSGYAVISRKSLGTVVDIQPFAASEAASCLGIDPAVAERLQF